MFRIKKFSNAGNQQKFHKKSESFHSDNNIKPLRQVQKSMPKLDNNFGVFHSGVGSKNGMIDLHKTYDLIQQYNQKNPNGGERLANKIIQKNNRTHHAGKEFNNELL